jgi:hypothetical protein
VTNYHRNAQSGRWRFWGHVRAKQSPSRILGIDLRNRTPKALRLGRTMAGKIRELEKVWTDATDLFLLIDTNIFHG